jgi:hypothetical protein
MARGRENNPAPVSAGSLFSAELMPLLPERSISCTDRAGLGRDDAKQGAESSVPGALAVEAKHELIEVALEVLTARHAAKARP